MFTCIQSTNSSLTTPTIRINKVDRFYKSTNTNLINTIPLPLTHQLAHQHYVRFNIIPPTISTNQSTNVQTSSKYSSNYKRRVRDVTQAKLANNNIPGDISINISTNKQHRFQLISRLRHRRNIRPINYQCDSSQLYSKGKACTTMTKTQNDDDTS